jgi:c-di-GMP-binding flagellar brake protein YcgR
MDPTQAPVKPFEYHSEGEQLTDPVQIGALLKKVKDSRTLIQVTVPGRSAEYNSALLDINREQGYLLLDELTPPDGHQLLREQGRLTVVIRLRGVSMRFTSNVLEIGGQAGIAFYRVEFPRQLYYLQRRAYYRVKLGMGLLVPLSITYEVSQSLEGYLDDISVGGIGAELKQHLPFNRGDLLPACAIQLPSGEKVDCEMEVRFISQDDAQNKFHLGARFINLDRPRQSKLKRFVAETERELLRRKLKE